MKLSKLSVISQFQPSQLWKIGLRAELNLHEVNLAHMRKSLLLNFVK